MGKNGVVIVFNVTFNNVSVNCGDQFENKILTISRNIPYGDYKYKKTTGHI
jgi:hypothetical protein